MKALESPIGNPLDLVPSGFARIPFRIKFLLTMHFWFPQKEAYDRLLKYKWIKGLRRQLCKEVSARWEAEEALDDSRRRLDDLEKENRELRNDIRGIDASQPDGTPNEKQLELARSYLRRNSSAYAEREGLAMIPGSVAVFHMARFLSKHQLSSIHSSTPGHLDC